MRRPTKARLATSMGAVLAEAVAILPLTSSTCTQEAVRLAMAQPSGASTRAVLGSIRPLSTLRKDRPSKVCRTSPPSMEPVGRLARHGTTAATQWQASANSIPPRSRTPSKSTSTISRPPRPSCPTRAPAQVTLRKSTLQVALDAIVTAAALLTNPLGAPAPLTNLVRMGLGLPLATPPGDILTTSRASKTAGNTGQTVSLLGSSLEGLTSRVAVATSTRTCLEQLLQNRLRERTAQST